MGDEGNLHSRATKDGGLFVSTCPVPRQGAVCNACVMCEEWDPATYQGAAHGDTPCAEVQYDIVTICHWSV